MYRVLYWLVLRRLPAEGIHRVSFALLRAFAAVPGGCALLRWAFGVRAPALATRALGLTFPSPLGLAAGFDKDARGIDALLALGFGWVEIGTVTPRPQPGNPKPRMFRLVRDRALVNRLGFNNQGADAVAARLRRRRARGTAGIVGVTIGKNKATPEAEAIADYVACTERLAPLADYLVVNVSSPNTPGLRDLQAVDRLGELLAAVRAASDAASPERRVPLLVKIAPDLADADVDAVAELALALGLDGIVATNTTISRAGLATPSAEVERVGAGGLSGPPVAARSLEVLRRLRAKVGDALVLIAVGGISDAADARARLDAGATLLQGYTGFVYGGPGWARRVCRGLAPPAGGAGAQA
ncbi:MAG: quinone-dependent dihydroorotate dehydrogenase [Kofleriaceae bacterium]